MKKFFSDQEMLADALFSQRRITESYNTLSNDCTTEAVRGVMLTILNEEHQIQSEIYEEMNKRGWVSNQSADPGSISRIKNRFSGEN
mgnify:CR=1 FL=1